MCVRAVSLCVSQITMADFIIADVTDSMLDGVIAGFPNTYATKVGKTSDAMYKAINHIDLDDW